MREVDVETKLSATSSSRDDLLESPPAHRVVKHILRSRVAETLSTPHYAAMMRAPRP